eukprot:1140950-Amphidinium_carterae.1
MAQTVYLLAVSFLAFGRFASVNSVCSAAFVFCSGSLLAQSCNLFVLESDSVICDLCCIFTVDGPVAVLVAKSLCVSWALYSVTGTQTSWVRIVRVLVSALQALGLSEAAHSPPIEKCRRERMKIPVYQLTLRRVWWQELLESELLNGVLNPTS